MQHGHVVFIPFASSIGLATLAMATFDEEPGEVVEGEPVKQTRRGQLQIPENKKMGKNISYTPEV